MCQFHSRLTTRAPSADRLLQNLQVRLCILLETSPETVQETFPFPPKPHWSVRCLSVSVDPFKKSWGLASFHSYSAQLTLFSAVVLKCSVFHFLKRYFKKKAPFSPQFYLSLNNNNKKIHLRTSSAGKELSGRASCGVNCHRWLKLSWPGR